MSQSSYDVFQDYKEHPLWCLWELTKPIKPKKCYLTENWLAKFPHLAKKPVAYQKGELLPADVANSDVLTFDEAVAQLASASASASDDKQYALGFGLREASKIWFLDVDNVRNPETQEVNPIGRELLRELHDVRGCAFEFSSSGTGLHFFGSGELPDHTCRYAFPHKGVGAAVDNNHGAGLELYHMGRGVALNSDASLCGMLDCPEATKYIIETVIPTYFPIVDEEPTPAPAPASVSAPSAIQNEQQNRSDEEVVRLLQKNAPRQWSLFCGEPSADNEYPSASEADYGLFTKLAYYTDRNIPQMMRIALGSPRAITRGEKWERLLEKECRRACVGMDKTYGGAVLTAAEIFGGCDNSNPGSAPAPVGAVAAAPPAAKKKSVNWPLYNFDAMADLFSDCCLIDSESLVVIRDKNRIHWRVLTPEKFNATERFKGKRYAMDSECSETTRNPWEAFAMSSFQQRQLIDGVEYDPIYPPGQIRIDDEYHRILNTWVPPSIRRVAAPDEVERYFVGHIRRILPMTCDHRALITWMCCVVQNPGHKMKWSPIIQGVQGNGKSLIVTALEYACGGEKYTRALRASEITGQFNSFLRGVILISIEELKNWDRRTIETVKTYITNEKVSIMEKYKNSEDVRTFCNFIFTTNGRTDITIDENERRFVMYNTAQQDRDAVNRDMPAQYFEQLFHWLQHQDGYAKIAHWLMNNDISKCEYNPLKYQFVAPRSSQHALNVKNGLGTLQWYLNEFIEQGCDGMRGGYVLLTRFMHQASDTTGEKYHPRKCHAALENAGYVKHPQRINIGNRSVILYVKNGHVGLTLRGDALTDHYRLTNNAVG